MTNHKIEFGFQTIFAVILKARKNNSIIEEGFVETKADYKNGQQTRGYSFLRVFK